MKTKSLIYNARIHTQAKGLIVDSMALYKNKIVAVGNGLQADPDFKAYQSINMKGKTIIPGLVDSHTHFYFFAQSLGRVELDGVESLEKCLAKIKKYASTLKKNEWVVGEGFSPNRFKKKTEVDCFMLDKVTGGRPAFIFTKDQHSGWVNSKALKLSNVDSKTKTVAGGDIVRFPDGSPSGILKEGPAYNLVYNNIPPLSKTKIDKLYNQALNYAWENGVTGVHSFDSPDAFEYFCHRMEKGKLGLRIDYYFPAKKLDELAKHKIYYGLGNDFLRVAGVKIFADGALGSNTALCFNKYLGSKNNYGIEVTPAKTISKHIKQAARMNLPCAIHAIGDKAVANVIDCLEQAPKLAFGARHRIEHVQMIRRKDIPRLKNINAVASVQPSHCPSDIEMIRNFWGSRSKNCYPFKTFQDKKIDMAFGSDAPIEPLQPIDGIAAAVRRARRKSRDVFHGEQKITAAEALYHYTVGAAKAVGLEHCRGYLMPDYPADFVVLDNDPTKVAPSKISDLKVLATVIDGVVKYQLKPLL